MTQPTIPSRVPAGATPEGDGIVVGAGLVRVDAYIDFLCPFCKQFELSAAQTLAALVSSGQASIAHHPMNFLDEASTTRYSTRASAASGCAADQGRFTEFAHALFEQQPPEGGPGLSDEQLAAIGREVGLTSPAFTGCLADKPYLDWPSYVTERAATAQVTGTPTVMVAGQDVPAEPDAIRAALAEAASQAR